MLMSIKIRAKNKCSTIFLVSVRPEMVDFGFRQVPSKFSNPGIARYVEDLKRSRTPPGAEKSITIFIYYPK
jgi:hypothetical protein